MMGVQRREGGNAVKWEWRDEGVSKVRLGDLSSCAGTDVQLRRRVYKGVPDRWRMAAWWTLAEARAGDQPRAKGKRKADELFMDYRVSSPPARGILPLTYQNSIDLPSSFDVQIDLDVPRTISGHTLFMTRYGAGQRSLFHVLHCFAMLCDTCGYCQGMGPIAATLLCYFDPEVSPVMCGQGASADPGTASLHADGPSARHLWDARYIRPRLPGALGGILRSGAVDGVVDA
jgi:hypothetical protein